ncbi:50S ribosomal protein L10 [Candidatus Bathyarchaeota archaeon]|nr:50S ribosomal protein L10 [Candidatus Bathyarchaeota archaeon]
MQIEVHKKLPRKKIEVSEKLIKHLEEYRVVAKANLTGVRASQIQELRRKLREKVEFIVAKNTIFRKAAEKVNKENLINFANELKGPSLFLFTNISPFSLAILLNKSKVKVAAKGGDIATNDIIVPAGNTGLPPGPIISEFSKLKIPTKIESGSIWIASDTIAAKKGEVISVELASLLSRLGIKSIEAGLSIGLAYEDGKVFTMEDLLIDLEKVKEDLKLSVQQALSLAVNASYLTPETAPQILVKAHIQALALAVEAEYPEKEALLNALKLAYIRASALAEKANFRFEETKN